VLKTVGYGKLELEMVGWDRKRQAQVENSGLELETAGSWQAWAENSGLALEMVGSCYKRWVCVENGGLEPHIEKGGLESEMVALS